MSEEGFRRVPTVTMYSEEIIKNVVIEGRPPTCYRCYQARHLQKQCPLPIEKKTEAEGGVEALPNDVMPGDERSEQEIFNMKEEPESDTRGHEFSRRVNQGVEILTNRYRTVRLHF